MFFFGSWIHSIKSGFSSIPSKSKLYQSSRQIIRIVGFYYSKPINRKLLEVYFPIIQEVMVMYESMRIGYIGDRTIKIGSWDFLIMRVYSAFLVCTQRNCHNLASDTEWKECADWSGLQKEDTFV